MQSIEYDGFRISFQRHTCPKGEARDEPPIILHHGLAQSAAHWFEANWCEAWSHRDVIGIDILGHGRSDRPHERAAYAIEKRSSVVMAIADACEIESFDFFGFSLGGRVGFELAASHPDRVNRLIVGGMHGLAPTVDRDNLERRIAVLRSNKWRLVERAVGAHRIEGPENDPVALALSTEAVLDWRGAADRLPGVAAPTLMFCAENDSLLGFAGQTAELLPNCRFVEIPEANHAASFYASGYAKTAVRQFLAETSG